MDRQTISLHIFERLFEVSSQVLRVSLYHRIPIEERRVAFPLKDIEVDSRA
jgi:hypothetical protein